MTATATTFLDLREASRVARHPVTTTPGTRSLPARARGARWGRALRRQIDPGTLAGVPVGEVAVVTEVAGDLDPASIRRLMHLGFAPGAVVQVLRRAPLGDPTVFRVADTEVALRRRHAAVIRVEATH